MSDALPRPRVVERGAPGWPERLEHLGGDGVPSRLWVIGSLPAAGTVMVAIVGSRRASHGGLRIAADIAADLADRGVVVVSGMARGIDGAAHRGALDAGGATVAVLGCGIELCYPPEHAALRERIAARGCVVSEHAGSVPAVGWHFPLRNRIIAALCEAVVVVEASARSGALSTARWAADLGRDVLAVPGSIRVPTAAGTNLLIRDGCRPYLSVADLLDCLPQVPRHGGSSSPVRAGSAPGAAGLAARVLDAVAGDPLHPDELAATLRVGAAELAITLTALQLDGALVEVCGGRVARTL